MPKTSFEDGTPPDTGIEFEIDLTYRELVYVARLIGRTRVCDGMTDDETLGLVSAHRKIKKLIGTIDLGLDSDDV